MKALNPILMSGAEVLPLVEGGKGISATNGESSGAWAACGGIGTFSGVNADSYDEAGNVIPQLYGGRTRKDRHEELVKYAIDGAVAQARIAHEMANGLGRIHVNILWEMGGAQRILQGVLDGAKGLIHGVTCGAGMPYRLAEIATGYGIYYYPIVSSGRAFRALWKRAYHKFAEFMGAVVYEDPWRAGGHNGLSNSEDPHKPEPPYPRVVALREQMREFGLADVPIIVAGGVWYLRDWEDWIDNPELGPISFQFGTRALLTKESPIPEAWKQRLLSLKEGDVLLNRFSPTGFWSSAVRNDFIDELEKRNTRQIAFAEEPDGERKVPFTTGARKKEVYVTEADRRNTERWMGEGFVEVLRTPARTLIFVTKKKMNQIHNDQRDCMGCLAQCLFSNWAETADNTSGRKADPRSYCIQKTLQDVAHSERTDTNLMFAGHGAYHFAKDPFYSNGFVPTVQELFERIMSGD